MINHSKSLFFSLFIHTLFFSGLFLLYRNYLPKKTAFKEQKICINLQSIKKEPTDAIHKKISQPIKKEKKRVHKKAPKRVKKKQIIKKKKIVHVAEIKRKTEVKQVTHEVQQKEELPITQAQPLVVPVTKKELIIQKFKSVDKEKIYIQNNLHEIVLLIKENLYYPRRARKRGIEGSVLVKFVLHENGTISNIQVLSSKSDILSRAAMKTINNLSGKFPKPSEELTLSVPINYELR